MADSKDKTQITSSAHWMFSDLSSHLIESRPRQLGQEKSSSYRTSKDLKEPIWDSVVVP
ncbi:hypothetical protein L1D34_23875 [Vibrio mediterranei]|uniref:hypothetical protein n=1 Tax=Vibrio mediterranei TaxID=689 RepID=UPI001EFD4CDD|nr:hypothetical protein [Vibrio mediterranei]MCG9627870.1 hypothetical protein [Vibrio mediterranei]MCY9855456.1 hypothetical protein [Vibrio mediterranei]